MIVLRTLALLAVAALCVSAEWADEDGVLVGTDDNLASILDAHEFALVEFYAPWCGHCKSLAPHYAEAAQTLKAQGSPAVLVKVDATSESKLAEEYDVSSYPTLKWIAQGSEPMEYDGARTAEKIVSWVNKKSGPPAREVSTADEVSAFLKDAGAVALGYFADLEGSDAALFVEAAKNVESVDFLITSNAEVATAMGLSAAPGLVVLKTFDNGRTVYEGEMTLVGMSNFVLRESRPLVIAFNDENAHKIFGGDVKTHLLVFVDTSDEAFPDIKAVMGKVAFDFREHMLFITLDPNESDNVRIAEYFGVDPENDLPAIRIINMEEDMAKFRYEADTISVDSLREFAQNFVDGKLTRHLMSEETPEDWDAKPVKILTGNNFAEVALAADKNVFVFFHAPWCGHCKQLAPTWEKLAEKYEGHSDIVIAKIDATANEMEEITIEAFPTLYFFPKDGKEAIEYEGSRGLDTLVTFVNDQTGVDVEVTAEETAEVEIDHGINVEYEEYDADEMDEEEETGHDEL